MFHKDIEQHRKIHSLRSHILMQWRPPEAAAQWPGVPSHPRRGGNAAMGPRPPKVVVARPSRPPNWRLSGQGPGAAHRCAPNLNRQEPPPAAHQHRSRHRRRTRTDDRSSHGGARIRQGGGWIGPRWPATVRNDMIVGREEEGVGRER